MCGTQKKPKKHPANNDHHHRNDQVPHAPKVDRPRCWVFLSKGPDAGKLGEEPTAAARDEDPHAIDAHEVDPLLLLLLLVIYDQNRSFSLGGLRRSPDTGRLSFFFPCSTTP